MNNGKKLGLDDFLKLSTEEVRMIFSNKVKSRVGVFVADGNRRMIMCQSQISPSSDEFYQEYGVFFEKALRQALIIFFSYGLNILFFPLFGPSLIIRKNKFQSITIPYVFQKVFQGDEWFDFFKEYGIRVKSYGDLSQLQQIDIQHLNMAEGIKQTIEQTASHANHTVFFGFMSENTPGLEMPQQIINFYKTYGTTPSPGEMVKMYYGEPISPADFIIFSNKLSGHQVLPPFITTCKANAYFFPVPGFWGLTEKTFRLILYDMLFVQTGAAPAEYQEDVLYYIPELKRFYKEHQDNVIGTMKQIGQFCVSNLGSDESLETNLRIP